MNSSIANNDVHRKESSGIVTSLYNTHVLGRVTCMVDSETAYM